MKKYLLLTHIGLSIMIMAFTACDNNDDDKLNGTGVLTLDAKDITSTSATLCGRLNVPEPVAMDFEFGFEFSVDSIFSEESIWKIRLKDLDEKKMFSHQLVYLFPATKYYYRSYMVNQIIYYQGDIKEFTTSALPNEINKESLPGLWRNYSNPQEFWRYFRNGDGKTWDESEDVHEKEAQPFQWTLEDDVLIINRIIAISGSKIPYTYIMGTLNDSVMFYKDSYKTFFFTRVNEK